MNAAARSIVGLSRSAHVSTILADLHLLKALERIRFKLAIITCRCLHGTAQKVWNCLPVSVKVATSLMAFRRQLEANLSKQSIM
jgi:hypothetical protein